MRILLTGGAGYLGSVTVPALRAAGHEVLTLGRHPGVDHAVCDLRDGDAVRKAVHAVGEIDAVVHLAARAHDFRGLKLADMMLANVATTRNLLDALRAEERTTTVRFVHASSVAVYDVLEAERWVAASESPYAASKLEAEHAVVAEPFRSIRVLRFAPIFDPGHLQDVAKRVFLPGARLKLRLYPPPMHSLCSLERAVQALVDAVGKPSSQATSVVNVADPKPFSQHELVGWFPGPALPVPAGPLRATAVFCGLYGASGRAISRFINKFISSSVW